MVSQLPVSLSEILEVRNDSGLSDDELLSVLKQSIEPLESLIENARASSVRNMGLSPDSVYFLPDGSVQLKPMPCEMLDQNFLPPEYAAAQQSETSQSTPANFALDLNKVYIYALGAVLSYALEHGSQGSVRSSPEIYSMLNLMTVRDPSVRLTLPRIAQMTEKHVKANNVDTVEVVQSLYRSIMGSEQDFGNFSFDGFSKERKQSVDVAIGFSDDDLTNVNVNGGIINEDFTSGTVIVDDLVDLSPVPPQNEFQPRMAESEKINDKSSTINGKKPLTFVQHVDRVDHVPDAFAEQPIINRTSLVYNAADNLLDVTELTYEEDNVESTTFTTNNNNRSNWIDFDDKRAEFQNKSKNAAEFFSSSDEFDDSVFASRPDRKSATENSYMYSNLSESVSSPPPSMAVTNVVSQTLEFRLDPPLESAEFDIFDTFHSVTTERRILSENASKSRILEKLMPTLPSEFTNPKDHGFLERNRFYHSVECNFCSPTKRSVCYTEERYRRSLPNLVYDFDKEERRFYTTKLYGSFVGRPPMMDAYKNVPTSHSIKRKSSNSTDASSPIADHNSPFSFTRGTDDPLFASFDRITTPNDKLNEQNSWHTVEIERPSSSSSVNSGVKNNLFNDKYKPRDVDDIIDMDDEDNDWVTRQTGQFVINRDVSTKIVDDCDDSFFNAKEEPIEVGTLEPIDENLVEDFREFNAGGVVASSSPKVALYEQVEKRPPSASSDDSPPSTLYRKLSRNNSMVRNGSIRNSKQRKRPPGTPDRKLSSDSYGKPVPVLGVHQILNQQQRNKFDGDAAKKTDVSQPSTVRNNNSSSPSNDQHHLPHHQRRRVSNFNQNMPGRSEPPGKGPEFFYNSRQPSIRLKAPSAQRSKKLFRHPLEKNVNVILLSGQRVDVACRTDCTAENIFEAVSTHTNLNEWHFFGLSMLKDGEHFFLEPEQRIEKFAPVGWRQASRHVVHARVLFVLYLRLKYYPLTLDFVKTEQTLHQIYLQLRRDILEERLQCGKDTAYQLAALALQAEYGDRPWESSEYFVLDHYLPNRHLIDEIGGEGRIRLQLSELHGQYAGTSQRDGETEFIKMCQNLREYGIHFHRLYRTKPSQLLTPSPLGDPETGTSLWIGIMPFGIVIFEERSGERVPISKHAWNTTDTLQYDHKKFIIVPKVARNENDDPNRPPPRILFYTDNYKKSLYLVHFAEAQHKFSWKMRQWAATLPSDMQLGGSLPRKPNLQVNGRTENASNRSSATETDSGLSRDASPDGMFAKGPPKHLHQHQERAVDAVLPPRSTPILNPRSPKIPVSPIADISIPAHELTTFSPSTNETITESFAKRLDEASDSPVSPTSDYQNFYVKLKKDPHYGLGLTLVDGEIQGIKGIYVRSLTPGGPADLEGRLRIGDKLISVNNVSLEGKTRHDAVDLVRQSVEEITMGIMRIKGMYSSNESVAATSGTGTIADVQHGREPSGDRTTNSLPRETNEKRKPSPTPRKAAEKSSQLLNSTFQSSLDTVGTNSMQWMDDTAQKGGVSFHPNSTGATMYGGLPSDSDHSVHSSDNEDDADHRRKRSPPMSSTSATSDDDIDDRKKRANVTNEQKHFSKSNEKVNNKDWTEEISYQGAGNAEWKGRELELITVVLEKNENGSLGIQVAGGKGQKKVYIKSLVAEPAISASKAGKILPGDQLASVNDVSTNGLSHQEVVGLLKNATSPVKIGVLRPKSAQTQQLNSLSNDNSLDSSLNESSSETLDVLLEKPASGSLGLSLAKPPGGQGIFIRVITPGSVAAVDGRLKVGDRLWMINGDSVERATPTEVVEKLKAAQGFVKLIVKREAKENNNNINTNKALS